MSNLSPYRQKIADARALIAQHNTGVADEKFKIDADKVIGKLQVIGGTSDYLLRKCTWEDLEDCGFPRLLAKEIADIFRRKI